MTTPTAPRGLQLPKAPPAYDARILQNALDKIERADLAVVKFGRDIELAQGERLILRAPDGSRWAVQVSAAGVLSAVAA